MKVKKCQYCDYFKIKINGPDTRVDKLQGTCHRYPPQVLLAQTANGVAGVMQNPLVEGDFGCGEFQLAGKDD